MSQRQKSPDPVVCETFMNRMLRKDKSTVKQISKSAIPFRNQTPTSVNTGLIKKSTKQQNIPSPLPAKNMVCEESVAELRLKSSKTRKRKDSTDSEPWGQLLRTQRTNDSSSFSKFDPLRTVHFLTKELKYRLQTVAQEDNAVQQMICDMELALKRVPPEVASAIHLQQAIDIIPSSRSRSSLNDYDRPEKLENKILATKSVQTDFTREQNEENELLHKIMTESTEKLETTCRQMEEICCKLKLEKEQLESKLEIERDNVIYYKNRLEEVEKEHKEHVTMKVLTLEEKNNKLEMQLSELKSKRDVASNDLKTLVKELKKSKSATEQECAKLKHQLKLSEIEKEKYMAVLQVRDRQINEIRIEMSQLQEVVNEQLMELHSNAFSTMPCTQDYTSELQRIEIKENNRDAGDDMSQLSTINPIDDSHSKDLESGDIGPGVLKEIPENILFSCKNVKIPSSKENLRKDSQYLVQSDTQLSIKEVLSELKRQAYAVNTPMFESLKEM